MKKQLILFDLDGTLLDTADGIVYCYNQTARHYGLATKEKHNFHGVIGSSLKDGFTRLLGMAPDIVPEAIQYYRALYQEKGMHMATVYEGMPDLLAALQAREKTVAVATLKHERFVRTMLEDAGLTPWIDGIYGATDDPKCNKAYLLNQAMRDHHTAPARSVLIGDSPYDANGAKTAGIDFIGVTYGWGFSARADVQAGYHTAVAESVNQILDVLEGLPC